MKYDYIIVGQGLSGSLLSYELIKRGKRVCVIHDNALVRSSEVAPGMYNPLVLKRYTLAWKAPELISNLENYYKEIEQELDCKFMYPMNLYRLFSNNKEAILWDEKSDQLALEPFMNPNISTQDNLAISKNFGLGQVYKTGRVILVKFIQAIREYIQESNTYLSEEFAYENLQLKDNEVCYGEIISKHIIFAEGYNMKFNPWFNQLPLKGTKGELITIKSPDLKLEYPIKSSVLVMPLGNDLYRVGASFNWDDKDCDPSETGKKWLISKLEQIISCTFEIVEHDAGIRPTVIDRRPLLGTHEEHKNMHVFNGMGTRGVMLAPTGVRMLIDSIENSIPLDEEWNIKRFKENA